MLSRDGGIGRCVDKNTRAKGDQLDRAQTKYKSGTETGLARGKRHNVAQKKCIMWHDQLDMCLHPTPAYNQLKHGVLV